MKQSTPIGADFKSHPISVNQRRPRIRVPLGAYARLQAIYMPPHTRKSLNAHFGIKNRPYSKGRKD
jgi:hypothetical protein